MTKREETFTLPGCSTWVLANAGATGYYRTGYRRRRFGLWPADAETKLTPGERICAGRYLGVSPRRSRAGGRLSGIRARSAVGPQSRRAGRRSGRLNYIGQYLVSDSDRDSYRRGCAVSDSEREGSWVGAEIGRERRAEGSALARVHSLGYDGRDPQALEQARKIADRAFADRRRLTIELAGGALALAALNGDAALYDQGDGGD